MHPGAGMNEIPSQLRSGVDPEMNPAVVLLPGLGADQRLFQRHREVLPDLIVPAWPEPAADDTLATFAARLAERIPRSDLLYLGGASFGGMVALELAALLRPRGVFLIGSCASPASISPLIRQLRAFARALPARAFHPRRWSLPLVLPKFGRLGRADRQLFLSMACEAPGAFLKWGVEALLSWRPAPVAAPIHHIHGSADRLIPLRLVRPGYVVPGGGHLLSLTHPQEVNAFLAEAILQA
jgi:pimeloyl-ACP methyl ester carboxylesterase